MTNIRRHYVPNTAIFITSVCYKRHPILKPRWCKELLLEVLREVKDNRPYQMLAYVILDDHFHLLIKPDQKQSFSKIIQSVKQRFSHRYKKRIDAEVNGIWQPRFWDHVIRDDNDLMHHLDYIHFNPAKHGFVSCAGEYQWSSFSEHCKKGRYPPDWGVNETPKYLESMNLE